MNKSFKTAHALNFLWEEGWQCHQFWAETMLGNEGNLGENIKSFKNSIPMADLLNNNNKIFWLCRVFNVLFLLNKRRVNPSRSNSHGKWKSHHLLTLAGSYAAGFPEEVLHQNAQDWC